MDATMTIVAVSTPPGKSALAVVRMSGRDVRFVSDMILRRPLPIQRATYVKIRNPGSGECIDDAVAVRWEAPRSATGEDVLELTCHGGRAVLAAVIDAILSCDGRVRIAEPGEFTRRAFENGRLDAVQVEGLADVLAAETAGQLKQARRQMDGELGRQAREWRTRLIGIRAQLEAGLDFADEDDVDQDICGRALGSVPALIREIEEVLGSASRGHRMRSGARVVLAGPPNVGKSSLLNALASRNMALVSPRPGTTRDRIEAPVDLDGWPVTLIDTAGLRAATDSIEEMGIALTREAVADADIILAMSTADAAPADREDMATLVMDARAIAVWSKVDVTAAPPGYLGVSSITGEGVRDLVDAIVRRLNDGSSETVALVVRARQSDALAQTVRELRSAMEAPLPELSAENLRLAGRYLGRLVGDTDVEELLDQLFVGFCIGK